jgi:hypothetical protein
MSEEQNLRYLICCKHRRSAVKNYHSFDSIPGSDSLGLSLSQRSRDSSPSPTWTTIRPPRLERPTIRENRKQNLLAMRGLSPQRMGCCKYSACMGQCFRKVGRSGGLTYMLMGSVGSPDERTRWNCRWRLPQAILIRPQPGLISMPCRLTGRQSGPGMVHSLLNESCRA